jgi:hypothetical protein
MIKNAFIFALRSNESQGEYINLTLFKKGDLKAI